MVTTIDTRTFTVSIPAPETRRFKGMAKLMGWTILPGKAETKSRLYDPETGECLNEQTMKVIEDARKGEDIAFTGSFEEFKDWANTI